MFRFMAFVETLTFSDGDRAWDDNFLFSILPNTSVLVREISSQLYPLKVILVNMTF